MFLFFLMVVQSIDFVKHLFYKEVIIITNNNKNR